MVHYLPYKTSVYHILIIIHWCRFASTMPNIFQPNNMTPLNLLLQPNINFLLCRVNYSWCSKLTMKFCDDVDCERQRLTQLWSPAGGVRGQEPQGCVRVLLPPQPHHQGPWLRRHTRRVRPVPGGRRSWVPNTRLTNPSHHQLYVSIPIVQGSDKLFWSKANKSLRCLWERA